MRKNNPSTTCFMAQYKGQEVKHLALQSWVHQ
uniref:Uncharacterized protein n=1 Tax=Arundo donax TaxID=35708 RepID=A0A0A8Z1Y3_ARUDO